MSKLFIILFFSLFFTVPVSAQIDTDQMDKFEHVLDLINMFYVDTLNDDEVVEKAIVSLLKELDPHSVYISKDKIDEMNESLVGSFVGIGITYRIFRDTIYIIKTVKSGPAANAGLIAGDRIVRIDNENVAGIGIKEDKIKEMLRGNEGTKVKIAVFRKSGDKIFEFKLVRAKIPLKSIPAAYKIDNTTAYIKLESFSSGTMQEFEKISNKLRKEGVQNIILDLRNNGGGYLSTAIRLIDEFMPSDRLLIYTKGKSSPRYDYFSTGKGHFKRSKLVVLINENSASASEIVAGAIQDWDRGLIVGRRSFGKGLVQRPFNLPDGSALRLTIARYYTPTGRLIQKTYENGYEDYINEERNRFEHGELFFKDSIYYIDSLKYYTLNRKRTVYGGGGIIPDIFVAADTGIYPYFYRKMLRNRKISYFVLDYLDKNRENLLDLYSNVQEFDEKFEVGEELLNSIAKYALENNLIDTLNAGFEKYKQKTVNEFHAYIFEGKEEMIKHHLKSMIAGDIWGDQAFYQIFNQKDDFVLKALSVIKNKHLYNSLLATSTF